MDPPIRLTGIDQYIAKLTAMERNLRGQTIRKAVMAAGEVAKQAMMATSPVRHTPRKRTKGGFGPIRDHIIIYERKRRDLWSQVEADLAMSILTGPSHMAFYAYFQRHGWNLYVKGKSRIGWEGVPLRSKATWIGGKRMPARPELFRITEGTRQKMRQAAIDVIRAAIGVS